MSVQSTPKGAARVQKARGVRPASPKKRQHSLATGEGRLPRQQEGGVTPGNRRAVTPGNRRGAVTPATGEGGHPRARFPDQFPDRVPDRVPGRRFKGTLGEGADIPRPYRLSTIHVFLAKLCDPPHGALVPRGPSAGAGRPRQEAPPRARGADPRPPDPGGGLGGARDRSVFEGKGGCLTRALETYFVKSRPKAAGAAPGVGQGGRPLQDPPCEPRPSRGALSTACFSPARGARGPATERERGETPEGAAFPRRSGVRRDPPWLRTRLGQ